MRFSVLVFALCVGFVWGGSDLDALLVIKKGIKEDPTGRLVHSWDHSNAPISNGCPSNWYGVQCDRGWVVSIVLNDMALVGELDFSALSGLQMLRNFSVSNNRLTGTLPPEMGSMKSVEFLDLSHNSFSGKIPNELMKIGGLSYLNLSLNNLDGAVPSNIVTLKQLEYLDLRRNSLSGSLSFIGQLKNAVHVDFSDNKFSGPLGSFAENSSIVSLLQYLNVSHNALSGKLFDDDVIPLFDNLEVFDASHNQLSGLVPNFQFVVSLRIVRLANNAFLGSLPEALLKEASTVLTELDLSNNQLEGPVGRITSTTLKSLNLSSNKFSSSLPALVGSCSIVDLSNNLFHGNLSTIRNWGNFVEVIHLDSNMLTGNLPNETSPFLRLASLKVSNNSLNGELPFVLGTYPELQVVDFSGNQLHGSLPPNLFMSFRLTELNLSHNAFTGSIPILNGQKVISAPLGSPLFTQNSSLSSLDLSGNMLSGSLPQGIGTLNQLKFLNIKENKISGQIPQEIGMLRNLEHLDLSGNVLTRSIPKNLPDSLIEFNVSHNDLSGAIPDNLVKFPDSSFHPGNTLLVFPPGSSSTANSNNGGNNSRRMKPLVRNVMIAALAGAAAVVVLISILIYCKSTGGHIKRKDPEKQISPRSHSLGFQKNVNQPAVTTGFPANNVYSPAVPAAVSECGDISMGSPVSTQYDITKLAAQSEHLSHATRGSPPGNNGKSPISVFSCSPASSDPRSSDQHGVLKVCSPDKLAGDLHLFDNSFVFTAEELSRAPAEILGRSCHGTSYKATLDSEHVVIVKWLREGLAKGRKDFAREAKKLGNIRHPNLVSLKGFYWGPKEHERLIISDYINSVSLTGHLCEFEMRKLNPLSLNQRLSIAIDIARCLNFLHNERAIPHGNLKSSNVVLQLPNLHALLTDYSLHRIMTPAGMAEQVLNAGALGYRPPEFASTSKPCPSLKSDVYAFGVILLELLTGKNAGEIASSNPGVVDLTDWVRLLANERRSFECFDRIIPGVESAEGPPKLMEDMLLVSLRCIRSASERPEIRTIFEDLSSLAT